MFVENQFSLPLSNELKLNKKLTIKKDIIIDRKSKYTLVGYYLEDEKDIKIFLKELKKDKYFLNATHNSYAYRIKQSNGSIIEGKNDDGETGAGMCILREIKRVNGVNMLIIITRYFGGIKLQTDRFKNVIDACKIFFKEL
ncbi:YigZ family protein [Candidatus Gracilibacteria bacterium]|nr:YigZ family protein [Candidatus Gracilibacteria bacterium]